MFRLDRDGKLWLMYLRITDTQYIELFPEATGDRAPPARRTASTTCASRSTASIASLAELEKAGMPLAREKKMGADGNLQAWIEDPDGNRIELMQMDPEQHAGEGARRSSRDEPLSLENDLG